MQTAQNQTGFNVAQYNEGDWRTALSDDYYERLGRTATTQVAAAEIEKAYQARYQWWVKREEQFKSGHQVKISLDAGPLAPRAKRNLEQAKSTLSTSAGRGQYDKERSRKKLGAWQEGDLRVAVSGLKGQASRETINALVGLGEAQGLPSDQVRMAVEAELTRVGVQVSASAVRAERAPISLPDLGGLPGRWVGRVSGAFERKIKSSGGDPAAAELFERMRIERQKAEEARIRRQQVARSLTVFSREENARIWNFARAFSGKWVGQTEWTQPSRIRLSKAEDGGALLSMAGFDIHVSCHQSADQWWYYLRFRGNRPTLGDWYEFDQDVTTHDQLKAAFMAVMERLLDASKVQ